MAGRRSGLFGSLVVALALGGSLGITFSGLFSTDLIPSYRDLLFFTWPIKHFLHERFWRGELPLWNPLLMLGTPYLANLQSGVFYPPSLLLLLPLPLGFNLFLLAHYAIALLGAWCWLRGRGFETVAASIGAGVFSLGGYLVSLLSLTNHLQAAAWTPWVLYASARLVRRVRPIDGVLLVIAVSLQFLGGSPENLLLTVLVAAVLAAHDGDRSGAPRLRMTGLLVAAAFATAGVCAVQMLPTAEYVAASTRAEALSFPLVATYSLQPVSLLQLIFPHSTALLPPDAAGSLGPSFEGSTALIESYYLGIVPLCLAITGLAHGKERMVWGSLLLAGVLLALGNHTPIFPAIYGALPWIVGKFRYPEKFWILVHVSACALAADGARMVLGGQRAAERVAGLTVAIFLTLTLSVCVLRWTAPEWYLEGIATLRVRDLPPTAFVPLALDTYWKARRAALVLCAAGLLIALRGRGLSTATAGGLLLGLSLVDLATANRNLSPSLSWAELSARSTLIDTESVRASGERIFHAEMVAHADPGSTSPGLTWWVPLVLPRSDLTQQYRLIWDTLNSDAGMIFDLPNVSGGDGFPRASDDLLLRTLQDLAPDRGVKLLRIFGAGWLIGPELPEIAGTSSATDRSAPFRALRIENTLPLAYLATRLRVVPTMPEALRTLAEPAFLPGRDVVVEALPKGWSDDGIAGSVTIVERRDARWRLRVEAASKPSFLVVNESYFPGWEASVDGVHADIVRANGIVRGIVLPDGSGTVELVYRPASFRVGAVISVVSLLALAIVAFSSRTRIGSTADR